MRARPGSRRSARSRQPLRPRRTGLSRAWPAALVRTGGAGSILALCTCSVSSPGCRHSRHRSAAAGRSGRRLDRERDRDHDQGDPDRPAEDDLGETAGQLRTEPAADESSRRTDGEQLQSTSVRAACAARPTVPTANPTTRFVPTALAAVMPTPRRSTGMRIVPRITPIAPPSAPTPRPPATAGAIRSLRARLRVERPEQQVGPVEGEDRGGDAEQRRLRQVAAEVAAESRTDDRRRQHPARRPRQETRPSRACRIEPDAADAALIPMFVPAAAAGLEASRRISGRRSVPSTSPSAEPRYPATNDPAAPSASCQASERLLPARVRRARKDEQQVGQPVHVPERRRVRRARPPAQSSSARRQTVRAR